MIMSFGLNPKFNKDAVTEDKIEKLGFPTRIENGLHRMGITTIDQLLETGAVAVLKAEAIGDLSLAHIKRVLHRHCASWQNRFIRDQHKIDVHHAWLKKTKKKYKPRNQYQQ
jgi:DNA-directed RNA polymerase alpha subunit